MTTSTTAPRRRGTVEGTRAEQLPLPRPVSDPVEGAVTDTPAAALTGWEKAFAELNEWRKSTDEWG